MDDYQIREIVRDELHKLLDHGSEILTTNDRLWLMRNDAYRENELLSNKLKEKQRRIDYLEGRNEQVNLSDLRLLTASRDVMAWLAERADFEYDCEPTYESDTNFYNHKDECPSMVELGVEATLTDLEKIIESTRRD